MVSQQNAFLGPARSLIPEDIVRVDTIGDSFGDVGLQKLELASFHIDNLFFTTDFPNFFPIIPNQIGYLVVPR